VANSKVSKLNEVQQFATSLTTTGTHMPYEITVLPEVTFPPLPQSIKDGTLFSDP